ncbi:hypothetical protein BH10ACT9_BH10ACT9_38730 [soil metagenome]
MSLGRFRVVVVSVSLSRVRGVLRVVGDSPGLVSELEVVDSPGTPMSVVDNRTLVGNVEDSVEDGVAMNGAVVRSVCWVVGTTEVTMDVVGRLHWSDIFTTVTTRPATRTTPTTPAVETAAELRYHGVGSRSGSGFDGVVTGADTSDPAGSGNSAAGVPPTGP